MIKLKKTTEIKKSLRSNKNYLKIINSIDQDNLNFKLDSEEKLSSLLYNINKFLK